MIHRRDAGEHGDETIAHRVHRGGGVEVVEQKGRRTGGEPDAEHCIEPEHVEHGQHAETDVTGVEREARVIQHLADVGRQVAMREHRRLRRSRRAGGEQQDCDVGVIARHRVGGLGTAGSVERTAEHDRRFDGRELAVELRVRRVRVVGHRDRARSQHPEVRRDERNRVVPLDRHSGTGLHALGAERAGDAGGARLELPVRDRIRS